MARTISAVQWVLGAGIAIPYPRLGVIDKRTYAEDVMRNRGERHPGNALDIIPAQKRSRPLRVAALEPVDLPASSLVRFPRIAKHRWPHRLEMRRHRLTRLQALLRFRVERLRDACRPSL